MAKPLFSVVIPTHNHAALLPYAVETVLWQTVKDFELIIVGDGVGKDTEEVFKKLEKRDGRIKILSFPKQPRNGELSRKEVLDKHVRGKYVAYQSDDDIWFPNHLEELLEGFHEANFVHTLGCDVRLNGQAVVQICDLSIDVYKKRLLTENYGFGLTNGAHTLELYRKLPFGWRTTPKGTNTDVYMWRQFIAHPDCVPKTILKPTSLHLDSPRRKHLSVDQRVKEMKLWSFRAFHKQDRELLMEQIHHWITFRYAETEAVIWRWTWLKRLPILKNFWKNELE